MLYFIKIGTKSNITETDKIRQDIFGLNEFFFIILRFVMNETDL